MDGEGDVKDQKEKNREEFDARRDGAPADVLEAPPAKCCGDCDEASDVERRVFCAFRLPF